MRNLLKIISSGYLLAGCGTIGLYIFAIMDRSPDIYGVKSLRFGLVAISICLANVILSILLYKRKQRRLCLFFATALLLWIPTGSILGVFTWLLLTRKEIIKDFKVISVV